MWLLLINQSIDWLMKIGKQLNRNSLRKTKQKRPTWIMIIRKWRKQTGKCNSFMLKKSYFFFENLEWIFIWSFFAEKNNTNHINYKAQNFFNGKISQKFTKTNGKFFLTLSVFFSFKLMMITLMMFNDDDNLFCTKKKLIVFRKKNANVF